MLTWANCQDKAEAWDEALMQFPDYTIYQSYAWGEHKHRFGWTAHRLVATQNSSPVAMAQVLVRRFPGNVVLAWVNGGPVGLVQAWGKPLREVIQRATGARLLYCRVNPMRAQNFQDVEQMQLTSWRKTTAPILSGMSMVYLPSENATVREAQASKNWRHNLHRSQKYNNAVQVWSSPNPDEMLSVYSTMQAYKNLKEQISRPTLVSILETFAQHCKVIRCNDAEGRLIALRGALLLGGKAWDIFAAATPEGRKVYASHATFWELMKQCALSGVQWYDMSGVDSVGNKGVYDFKKGTGASALSFLGEWDWATSPLLRYAANYLIKRRGGGM